MAELKASANLMTLTTGLYCIVQVPTRGADPNTGLPGVRISAAPGPASRPEVVSISTFRPDGWMNGGGDAALVKVLAGPAQVLVTIYQAPNSKDAAPNLQVMRLLEPAPGAAPGPDAGAPRRPQRVMDMVAHIQERGDVGALFGDWLGETGSKRWIEGFAIAPSKLIAAKDVEYQAVLGKGWLSPWVEGGQFCGSRGMALPILGLRLRLRGEAAEKYDAFYAASFIDGTTVGPVGAGEPCEAESLAPIEAFQVQLLPKGESAAAAGPAPAAAKAAAKAKAPTLGAVAGAKPATKPPAKPTGKSGGKR
jgi:hypothetical protein